MSTEQHRGDFEISTDPTRLDVEAIHAALTRSYWAAGIPEGTVRRSFAGSLCFGLCQQVGFTELAAPERLMELARPGIYRER